jgi:hypothetical protein
MGNAWCAWARRKLYGSETLLVERELKEADGEDMQALSQ